MDDIYLQCEWILNSDEAIYIIDLYYLAEEMGIGFSYSDSDILRKDFERDFHIGLFVVKGDSQESLESFINQAAELIPDITLDKWIPAKKKELANPDNPRNSDNNVFSGWWDIVSLQAYQNKVIKEQYHSE